MAKLAECLKGSLPAEFVSARIWSMVGEPKQAPKNHGSSVPRRESRQEIFRAGQGHRVHKRVRANCTPSTGIIVMGIRVGTYTACVCKCKM